MTALKAKRQNPIVAKALKLAHHGYWPIQLHDGKLPLNAQWVLPDIEDILEWHDKGLGVCMLDTLFAIKISDSNATSVPEILEMLEDDYPSFMGFCLRRRSEDNTVTLFGQIDNSQPYTQRYTGEQIRIYSSQAAFDISTKLLSQSRGWITVWNRNTENVSCGFDGPPLWDVPLDQLPFFPADCIDALLDIVWED